MEKKYILTDDTIEYLGHTLHRIQAVKDFGTVSVGTLGGFIESEKNLDHDCDAWVSGNAWVSGDARVSGDAMVFDKAWVSDNAWVSGDARVSGDAWVHGNARVSGDAWVYGNARVSGDAWVSGEAKIHELSDIASIKGFGSEFRATSFFRCVDGLVRCQCGCFYGTIDEFRSKVRKTHGNSKYAKEYLMTADLMELHFKED